MTLITSISGIRGTLGGLPGTGLTPPDIVKFVTAFTGMLKERTAGTTLRVVVGRDGRASGAALSRMVCGTLQFCGADVIDLGLSTTPTVELAVPWHHAHGGIILTASHNPAEWNALKLLNESGEFISEAEGNRILQSAQEADQMLFPDNRSLGSYTTDTSAITRHIEAILRLPMVNREAVRRRNFTVAFDAVNSTGGIALPPLLEALGVQRVIALNDNPDGRFSHNPEPLPEHLTDLAGIIVREKADLGFAVDPDVDRLAIISEDGTPFGEEYTLVAVADYILKSNPGNTVSNLSSSRALRDVTLRHGGRYHAAAVGEVNVVAAMKEHRAIIGGEGNGGVILPELHYGRDALAGIALFLSHLATTGLSCSALRKSYPNYFIRKNRVVLDARTRVEEMFNRLEKAFPEAEVNRTDGLKLDFDKGWIHLRKSNTEPIIRIYSEATSETEAEALAQRAMEVINP
ncbi:MAG TPA: phosphoglucosamine mutase [Bacteroidales bacterium]|nr:phosphoglucosamine mutase [Bacteroidales bacterium]HRZ48114.1 phosphoglucosamine mutase [Bacteroidales bacterium]